MLRLRIHNQGSRSSLRPSARPHHLLILLVVLATACGRTSLGIGGDMGQAPAMDSGGGEDQARPPDAATPGCGLLKNFASGKRVLGSHMQKAVFSGSLRYLALLTHKPNLVGDLVLVSLMSGKATTLAAGVSDVEWLAGDSGLLASKSSGQGTYDLYNFPLGGPGTKLGVDLCAHRASLDGTRVYVVSSCSASHGRLTVVDVKSTTSTLLDKRMYSPSVVVSPDGRWAGYLKDVACPLGCSKYLGTLRMVRPGIKPITLSNMTLRDSLQFSPAGRLLLREVTSCKSALSWLVSFDPGAGKSTRLTADLPHFAFKRCRGFPSGSWGGYAVSPDGQRALVAGLHSAADRNDLLLVRANGSGSSKLVSDLIPYQKYKSAMCMWTFADHGRWVVYRPAGKYAEKGLSAVPSAGSQPTRLVTNVNIGEYQVSKYRDRVAWLDRTVPGVVDVMLATLSQGTRRKLLGSKDNLGPLTLMPDGRGVLLMHGTVGGTSSRLLYLSAQGGSPHKLSKLTKTSSIGFFSVDTHGCAVVYNSDLPAPGGTYVRLLPR